MASNSFLKAGAPFSGQGRARAGSVLLRTARRDAENARSYVFADPVKVLAARRLEEIPAIFSAIEVALRSGFYVAGFLSYEAGYHFEPAALRGDGNPRLCDLPLAWFGVYRERQDEVTEYGRRNYGEAVAAEFGFSCEEYGERVARIRDYIAAGDFYQANLTMPVEMPWAGDAAGLFARVMESQPVAYGALIDTGAEQIISASPELLFRRQGRRITVRPMKGTAARGVDAAEDEQQAAWLAADEKNRAENVMIVDLLRNDLGRICRSGSAEVVELFAVERHPELLQMTSTVRGELKAGIGYDEIFRSLFPCGSITGAPKVRTMQAIRELEDGPRGISCGAIGYFAPDDEAVFSVAIRTAVLRDGVARMRVGSGITWDSDAGAEYAECLLKARFLTRRPEQFDLIETLRWEDGYFLLEPHLERLRASAEYFAFCLEEAKVREALRQEAEDLEPGTPHRVRLLLARAGKVSVTSEALSGTGSAVAPGPARMMLAGERTESRDVLLRHKTTRREVYDRALREARAGGFDDAVFVNERGEVTEGAIHNLMIAKGGRFVTPAVACGLLPGVYRRWLLERHPEIVEGVVTLEDLRRADRVMVFNSVRGLRLARVM